MDPVEHYFRLRENDVSHSDAIEHIRLRFGLGPDDLTDLLDGYRKVVTARLVLVAQAKGF